MIKAYTAMTREIDDTKAAATEILKTLDIENNLLKNSIGIIACFSEYDDTGALREICDALPFSCIGATTSLCATGGEVDQIMFIITVITSDICDFKTCTIPIDNDYANSINAAVTGLMNHEAGKPSLLFGYFPFNHNISSDVILRAIDRTTGGIPLFGTVADDHLVDFSTAKVIRDGAAMRDTLVLCAVYGEVDFSFEVASLDKERLKRQKAIVTESDGNLLISVNDKPALEYFEEIGIAKNRLASGAGIIPLFVDYQDSELPIARGIFAVTPEGYAVCGGEMPPGSTFSVGRINSVDVLSTTKAALSSLTNKESVVLGYSCVARYLVQGSSNIAEAKLFTVAAGDTPYLFANSGGELCPLPNSKGKLVNYFHNYSNVLCRLM